MDGSGLMQPLWAPQPNIYNSGITRGGPEAGGDPNGSITANRRGSHCYQTIDNRQPTKPGEWGRNKDTQDKKAKLDKILFVLAITLLGKRTHLTSMN